MILLFSKREDYHSVYVERRLRERGAEVCWFDYSDFPAKSEVALSFAADGRKKTRLRLNGADVDLSAIGTAWFRRPGRICVDGRMNDRAYFNYVERESVSFLRDYLWRLNCRWIPGPEPVINAADHKARQLDVAASLGFELPPTLFTNDPDEFLDFYRAHDGYLISKCCATSYVKDAAGAVAFNMRTSVVSPRDVGYAESIRLCPVIFQAYVPKRVELRITVVGDRVFACEIHSQVSERTRHDWRNYDLLHTPHREHALPDRVRAQCLALVEKLGLCYGAIDMIVTPDDRYVFIEINSNGQYLWIEEATGMPITEAMCDLLMREDA